MNVLIVESNPDRAELWARHLRRQGAQVCVALGQDASLAHLRSPPGPVDIIVLNLILEDGSAFVVADYASYRAPRARIIFVTSSTFFSDGSIFRHVPNACAFLPAETPVDDLAALVEHYGRPN